MVGKLDLEKAFHIVPRRVTELAMRKKRFPEILVNVVKSFYEGAENKSWIETVGRISV